MKAEEILQYCRENYKDIAVIDSWGETSIFYNPNNALKRGVYVLTIKEKDGQNDRASNLDREGVYRVNVGVKKSSYEQMFGKVPKRPQKGGVVEAEYDFTKLDEIMPHPVYAWMGWIAVLNPSKHTFDKLKPLMDEAYLYACEKFSKRK